MKRIGFFKESYILQIRKFIEDPIIVRARIFETCVPVKHPKGSPPPGRSALKALKKNITPKIIRHWYPPTIEEIRREIPFRILTEREEYLKEKKEDLESEITRTKIKAKGKGKGKETSITSKKKEK